MRGHGHMILMRTPYFLSMDMLCLQAFDDIQRSRRFAVEVCTPYFSFRLYPLLPLRVCTPYFPFGFVPPTSSSGLYPLLLLRVVLLDYWRSSPIEMHALDSGFVNDIRLKCIGYSQNGGISREAAYAIRCGLKHNDTNACVSYTTTDFIYEPMCSA